MGDIIVMFNVSHLITFTPFTVLSYFGNLARYRKHDRSAELVDSNDEARAAGDSDKKR